MGRHRGSEKKFTREKARAERNLQDQRRLRLQTEARREAKQATVPFGKFEDTEQTS